MEQYSSTTSVAARRISSIELHSDQPVKIIPDAMLIFKTSVNVVIFMLLSALGIIGNIINICVYWNHGFRDSVNITFMALSVWDLNVCVFTTLTSLCFISDIYFPLSVVKGMSILYVYIAYTKGCMYAQSTLVTVYLSVERFVCIILPFKVKAIFTTPRVILVNWIIVLFGLACYCPAWATQGMQWVFDSRSNTTRLILWVSANRRYIDLFIDTFNGMVIPVVAQLLITVSAGFMIQRIGRSSKFRQEAVSVQKHASVSATPSLNNANRSKVMTNKDMKLTKVVILLSLIFFTCNLPVFIVAFLRALIPEIDVGKSQHSLYTVLYAIVYLFGTINSSVNILVYYNVSTRYRYGFRTLFRLHNPVTTY